jgi:phage tail sheath gpL-like
MVTAVSSNATVGQVGIKTEFTTGNQINSPLLPQSIYVVGQGNTGIAYTSEAVKINTAALVASKYGNGSPLHLAAKAIHGLTNASVPVYFYGLQENVAGVAATNDITITGTQTQTAEYQVVINNIKSNKFSLIATDTATTAGDKLAAAVNATLGFPVSASNATGTITLTAKSKGSWGNELYADIIDGSGGFIFAGVGVKFTGGASNADVQPALDAIADSEYRTMIVNTFDLSDATALDAIKTKGEARWNATIKKPFVSFVGSNEATTTAITAVTSTRADDRINSVFANPDSKDLPLVIASSIAKYVAEQANNSPAENYAGTLSQLNAGTVEWGLTTDKEDAKTQGVGFVRIVNGVVKIHEVITMFDDSQYAEISMPYRKVSDITRLQNVSYACDLKLGTDFYKEAVLVEVGQTIRTGVKAVTIQDIKAAIVEVIKSLVTDAILTNQPAILANLIVEKDDTNPDRVNIQVPTIVSGNTSIFSIDLAYQFNLGA